MQTENRNIYKKPREIAGYSQERAAELLDISVESLRAYETGRRVPPGEVVVRMMDLYNCQYLAVSHLRTSEACASFLPDVKLQYLPTAILRLQKELNDFLKCREEVLDITCDGVISPEERPRWEKVLKELDDVSAAIMAVKFAD